MEAFCRGCLKKYSDPNDLLQYCEGNRRMFIYSTGIQVKRNDSFTFQLCKECFTTMKQSCKFKKICRSSDKKFRNYLTLKEHEESTDFNTYLKNTENTLTLKLPTASSSSTPAHVRNKDDDNESTCTSIRNFMTDILQDEEMPPSEARIIHEVIQEEADILDDSLDSHWMQDDMSMVSEFEDFNFSTFSTPAHSINNYTPIKLDDKEEELNYYTPRKYIEQSPKIKDPLEIHDMPILDDVFEQTPVHIPNYFVEIDKGENVSNSVNNCKTTVKTKHLEKQTVKDNINDESILFENSQEFIDNVDLPILSKVIEKKHIELSIKEFCKTKENVKGIKLEEVNMKKTMDVVDGADNIEQSPFTQEIEQFLSKTQKRELEINLQENAKNDDLDNSNLSFELDNYINKAELKQKSKQDDQKQIVEKDTIDRNLEIALKNQNNTEFSLDQIIMTPQACSGASTPTIRNILFGGMTPKEQMIPNIELQNKDNSNFVSEKESNIDIESFLKNPKTKHKGKDISTMENLVKEAVDLEKDNTSFKGEPKDETEDWDINVSNLLQVGENEVDLDISISSDFLEDKLSVSTLKQPFAQTNDKYDLEKFFCKVCPKPHDSLKALKLHFAKTHKFKIITPKIRRVIIRFCEICGKGFRDPSNLNKHLKSHEYYIKNPENKCSVCNMTFETQVGLRRHMVCHKDNSKGILYKTPKGKLYDCSICGIQCRGASNFTVHMRRHTNRYAVHCSECNQGFYTKSDLVTHMRVHTGEKPFSCEFCPKSYKRRTQLTFHRKKHLLDPKTYQCDTCHMKFQRKILIVGHLKTGKCPNQQKIQLSQKQSQVIGRNKVKAFCGSSLEEEL